MDNEDCFKGGQFIKCLDSFDGYKDSVRFRREIEKDNEEVLEGAVEQIELILKNPTARIVRKVQSLRFIRDIMLLAKESICALVEQLLRYYIEICCYNCKSANPDRGETYFHTHPQYLALDSEEEKAEVDAMGTTFLFLSLESVWQWAKWIPADRHHFTFATVYDFLVEKGVVFPVVFYYYKQEDMLHFTNLLQKQKTIPTAIKISHQDQFSPKKSLINWLQNYGLEYEEEKTSKKVQQALKKAFQKEKQLTRQLNRYKEKSTMLEVMLSFKKNQEKQKSTQLKNYLIHSKRQEQKYNTLKQKYVRLFDKYQETVEELHNIKENGTKSGSFHPI